MQFSSVTQSCCFPRCELQAHWGKAAHAVDLCSGVSRFLGTGEPVIEGGMLNYGFPSSICTYLVTLSSWCWKKEASLDLRRLEAKLPLGMHSLVTLYNPCREAVITNSPMRAQLNQSTDSNVFFPKKLWPYTCQLWEMSRFACVLYKTNKHIDVLLLLLWVEHVEKKH